jgi:hypothetical protein
MKISAEGCQDEGRVVLILKHRERGGKEKKGEEDRTFQFPERSETSNGKRVRGGRGGETGESGPGLLLLWRSLLGCGIFPFTPN